MARGGLTLACLVALALACFGGVLFRDRQFAFRDAGYFYYPLHLRVQQEWQAGRWPLWAPEANAGMPLLGNPTAAVLYPGKLVFFLLPYPWAARMYVLIHVLLGLVAMWALLRAWRISATGSGLGALAYAFGAPVLGQTCNVIYLVGAGWAPLGFLAADRWLRRKHRGALAGLALVLAMQVLGGDPQAAYVTVVCASGYAAGLAAARAPSMVGRLSRRVVVGLVPVYLGLLALSWWSARAGLASSVARGGTGPPWSMPTGILVLSAWGIAAAVVFGRALGRRGTRGLGPMMGGLVGASALALAVAGAQLVPAVEFAWLSLRAAEFAGLPDVYRFSIHPLQIIEAIWPNVYGTVDRGNYSWIVALPRMRNAQLWVPSLYLGGLTLVLASASAGFRGGPPWRTWLTCVAVVSLLAGLGAYGSPLFWARCVPGWASTIGPLEPPGDTGARADGFLRDGDGGVYWFLASTLPAFGSFRYPGKFLVFTTLAVSGLAGAGWDRLVAGRSRRAEIVVCGLLALSLLGLASAWLAGGSMHAWLRVVAESVRSIKGPLDVEGAMADLRGALTQGGLVLALALVLVRSAARRPGLAGAIAVAALTLDLGLANARHVITAPQSAFEGTPRVLKVIQDAEKANPSPGPFRVERVGSWAPREWLARGSPRRFEEITRWERGSLSPNYGMPLGVSSTFSLGTTELFDYGLFFFPWTIRLDQAAALGLGLRPGQEVLYYPRRGFDLWNTRYFIVPSVLDWNSPERGYAAFLPRSTPIDPQPGAFDGPGGRARRAHWERSDDVQVLRNEAAFPRAWVVHQARVFPPVRSMRPYDRRELMQEILFQDDEFWHEPTRRVYDPRRLAWIETDRPDEVARSLSRDDPDPSETVTVTRDEPRCVELTAVLRSPGLVVLADVYYPGWTLTVDGHTAEILRTNRAMRGATLPAGTHHLVFRYEPLSFRIGMAFSILGLIALAVLGAWGIRQKESCRVES
jgi:hypothetical protein